MIAPFPSLQTEDTLDDLVERLKHIGLSAYEAKVYLGLLRQHPATGYEVSQLSGVPQARVYEILRSLEANQLIVSDGQKPVTYSPISPEQLLDRYERAQQSHLKHLRKVLPAYSDTTIDPVLNLRGEASIINHALDMIEHATTSIYLEAWKQDLPALQRALRQAQERGVPDVPFGQLFQHHHGELIEASLGGRWLMLCVDDAEGLIGTSVGSPPTTNDDPLAPVETAACSQGVYTRNRGIVTITKMLIVHDMFIIDIESHLRPELERVYGKELLHLRQRILGEQATVGFH
jgi:HTH-type transcriptional regulator, sugar sensing transcriptional regulator